MHDFAPSLLVVPEPIRGESPASWLYRLCHMHGVSHRTLLSAMNIKGLPDPDLAMKPEAYQALVLGTNVSTTTAWHLSWTYRQVSGKQYESLLLCDGDGRPSYRFCPDCLASDPIPFLRVSWRFSDWKFCPTHRLKLATGCHECNAPLRATYKRQPDKRTEKGWVAIRSCRDCGASLDRRPRSQPLPPENFPELLNAQKILTTALMHGKTDIADLPRPISRSHLQKIREWLMWDDIGDELNHGMTCDL
jgi:hypothetical protein